MSAMVLHLHLCGGHTGVLSLRAAPTMTASSGKKRPSFSTERESSHASLCGSPEVNRRHDVYLVASLDKSVQAFTRGGFVELSLIER